MFPPPPIILEPGTFGLIPAFKIRNYNVQSEKTIETLTVSFLGLMSPLSSVAASPCWQGATEITSGDHA